jgi:hypothetical protein
MSVGTDTCNTGSRHQHFQKARVFNDLTRLKLTPFWNKTKLMMSLGNMHLNVLKHDFTQFGEYANINHPATWHSHISVTPCASH